MTTIPFFCLKSKIYFEKWVIITNSMFTWPIGFINIISFRHINPIIIFYLYIYITRRMTNKYLINKFTRTLDTINTADFKNIQSNIILTFSSGKGWFFIYNDTFTSALNTCFWTNTLCTSSIKANDHQQK